MKLSARIFRSFAVAFYSVVFACSAHAAPPAAPAELAIQTERAFPNLRIRRPIVITNAADGSDRVFVAEQQGVVRFFANDQNVKNTTVFLDIESRVMYKDKENEEGLLGLAFHPDYKKNGELFIYYTTTDAPQTSVISRFRVSKDDPNKADPASEEELLRIKQPFWNHNGGTIVFGPDGYLYIALGDGGKANDPFDNAQNLGTLLGSVLRIDVNHKSDGKNYAIPKDNPFVSRKGARPEIWAYGLRNIWRMSFDRETGELWAGDVGQNLWEEIDILVAGGNYGWNIREGKNPFGPKGAGPHKNLIEPIWEFHHAVDGKSITGGGVYRGKKLPELQGAYLYADYVSGRVWALQYDRQEKVVLGNHLLKPGASVSVKNMPVITFGEDEAGEVYFTDAFGMIYRFNRAK